MQDRVYRPKTKVKDVEELRQRMCTNGNIDQHQWRSNRVCRVCNAHGPGTVGGPKIARRCFFK